MSIQYKLDFQNASLAKDIPDRFTLQHWVNNALENRRTSAELTIRIVDTEEMIALNETYRHKQGPTNVLSFPSEVPDEIDNEFLGDIIICSEIVRREAQEQHKLLQEHWAHMVTHGILHLLGYDHIKDDEAEQMEQLEIQLLKQLGFNNPYESERHGE